jgi:hypothetical protein
MTWGLNFGTANITVAQIELKAISNTFEMGIEEGGNKESGVILKLVELGNEPDLYSFHGDRPKSYNDSDYVSQCLFLISYLLNALRDRCRKFVRSLTTLHSRQSRLLLPNSKLFRSLIVILVMIGSSVLKVLSKKGFLMVNRLAHRSVSNVFKPAVIFGN